MMSDLLRHLFSTHFLVDFCCVFLLGIFKVHRLPCRQLFQDGRVLGAGAVLRLGGAHLGGYGESDIAYAYRQVCRLVDQLPLFPYRG